MYSILRNKYQYSPNCVQVITIVRSRTVFLLRWSLPIPQFEMVWSFLRFYTSVLVTWYQRENTMDLKKQLVLTSRHLELY